MKADAVSILAIFERKLRLEVPLFQRQYVWAREQQWEPLWDDISHKFVEYLEGHRDTPVHFLGAMVLDQKQTPTTHVEKRQVIDGQQRLTTLQVFLAALRDFCREHGCEDLGRECEGFTLNKGMMADPDVEKYKVWPTQLDRAQFVDVITSGSRMELEKRHPVVKRKRARKPDPRPKMIEAYLFFYDQLNKFFFGEKESAPIGKDVPLAQRLEECFQALKNALRVVVIDLEPGDDPQVIFETLNARGEPLLPADLLRNFIFLRAARLGEPQEQLYNEYWRRFDDPFWRESVKQGRLLRPRSDLFLQHFLASRLATEIPIRHLFATYKHWIEKDGNFPSVLEELATLARQGQDFRRITTPTKNDPLFTLASFLEAFDVRTSYPFLLAILDKRVDDDQLRAVTNVLESYLLRRAICGLPTKNYNRVFLTLTRNVRRDAMNPTSVAQELAQQLAQQTGESAEWPSDAAFGTAWRTMHAYHTLNNPKIVYVLKRLSDAYLSDKMETLTIDGPLQVEHILPQKWVEGWPLPGGARGLTAEELHDADANEPRTVATKSRNSLLHTLGNLTIITGKLNASISNGPWSEKKPELLKQSLLPINQMLHDREVWDEGAIAGRGEALFKKALELWPRMANLDTPERG